MKSSTHSAKEEEILEAILYLQLGKSSVAGIKYSNNFIPVAELVSRLEKSCVEVTTHTATLNTITRKLSQKKEGGPWLEYEPHVGVRFTEIGLEFTKTLLRNHRLAERLLVELLGLFIEEAHSEACLLEHAISERVADKIEKKLGSDKAPFCPHGFPIPSKEEEIPETYNKVLSNIKSSTEVILRGLVNESSQFLIEIRSYGLELGVELKILENVKPHGPICVHLQNEGRLILPREIASSLLVEIID